MMVLGPVIPHEQLHKPLPILSVSLEPPSSSVEEDAGGLMETVLTPRTVGHVTPSAVLPPRDHRGHGLAIGLTCCPAEKVLTRRPLPDGESASLR